MNIKAGWRALWSPGKAPVPTPAPAVKAPPAWWPRDRGGRYDDEPYGYGYGHGYRHEYGHEARWLAEAAPVWLSAPVMACLSWLCRNVPSADLAVYTPSSDHGQDDTPDFEHEAVRAFRNADGLDFHELIALGVVSYCTWGMTFYRVVRDVGDGVARLQWVPPYHAAYTGWGMRPVGSATELIRGFEYYVNGQVRETLPPEEVVYVRTIPDPDNPRLGVTPLLAGLTAIVGLKRAEQYLANFMLYGTGHKVFVPETDVDEPTAEGIRGLLNTIDLNRSGQIRVASIPGSLLDIGADPLTAVPTELMDRWERTVCALLGVSAMTVGLAAGATMQSYANQEQADKQSWANGCMPIQDQIAWAFTRTALALGAIAEGQYFGWDRTKVPALQEDRDAKVARAVQLANQRAVFSDNEIRAEAGFPPLPEAERDVPHEEPDPIEMAEARAGAFAARNGNGNGRAPAEDGDDDE